MSGAATGSDAAQPAMRVRRGAARRWAVMTRWRPGGHAAPPDGRLIDMQAAAARTAARPADERG